MNGNTIELGLAASVLTLGSAILAVIFSTAGVRLNRPSFVSAARQAVYINFALITLACITIIWSFVVLDLSVLYVAQNANKDLPIIYRVTALWGAHEGSLMLWLWYLVGFTALATFLHRKSHSRSMPYVIVVLALLQIGFLLLILFLSNPFTEVSPPLNVGRELNPLLQDPGLIFHPPILYLGYVGFSIPFAFAMAALIRGQADNEWVVAIRRWTLFAWGALTSGIMLGGYWAYYELGWGGYWAWDPVENASLMPWLTGTAFLHSIMALERRGLFKTWTLFLIITTFCLSLLGTFLVRSGILTSVHAFAVDPGRGLYILIFLTVVLFASFGMLIFRGERLRSLYEVQSLISRETTLLFNNIFLLTAAATVCLGTLYPLAAEMISGVKLTVAAPYFNLAILPMMLIIVLLMAVGPIIPWRNANARLLIRQFLWPSIGAIMSVIVAYLAGIHLVMALIAIGVVALAFFSTIMDVGRASRARAKVINSSLAESLLRLIIWNRRRHGGLLVHLGVLVVAMGIIVSGTMGSITTVKLSPGERVKSGQFTLTFLKITPVKGPNYTAREATLAVSRDGIPIGEMKPQRRSYPIGKMVTTEAAIRTTLSEDLYVVLGQEQPGGEAVIRVYYNPMIVWIWIGWAIIAIGSILSLTQGHQRADAPYRQTHKETAADIA